MYSISQLATIPSPLSTLGRADITKYNAVYFLFFITLFLLVFPTQRVRGLALNSLSASVKSRCRRTWSPPVHAFVFIAEKVQHRPCCSSIYIELCQFALFEHFWGRAVNIIRKCGGQVLGTVRTEWSPHMCLPMISEAIISSEKLPDRRTAVIGAITGDPDAEKSRVITGPSPPLSHLH